MFGELYILKNLEESCSGQLVKTSQPSHFFEQTKENAASPSFWAEA